MGRVPRKSGMSRQQNCNTHQQPQVLKRSSKPGTDTIPLKLALESHRCLQWESSDFNFSNTAKSSNTSPYLDALKKPGWNISLKLINCNIFLEIICI